MINLQNNFNLEDMMKEPDFTVNPEKYITRLEALLKDIDIYIKDVKSNIDKQSIPGIFGDSFNLIMTELQRETIINTIQCLKYSNR